MHRSARGRSSKSNSDEPVLFCVRSINFTTCDSTVSASGCSRCYPACFPTRSMLPSRAVSLAWRCRAAWRSLATSAAPPRGTSAPPPPPELLADAQQRTEEELRRLVEEAGKQQPAQVCAVAHLCYQCSRATRSLTQPRASTAGRRARSPRASATGKETGAAQTFRHFSRLPPPLFVRLGRGSTRAPPDVRDTA